MELFLIQALLIAMASFWRVALCPIFASHPCAECSITFSVVAMVAEVLILVKHFY